MIPHCLSQKRCENDWINDFIGKCLRDTNSPARLVADCLLSAGLMMDPRVDRRRLANLDKRYVQFCYIGELTLTTLQCSHHSIPGSTDKLHPQFTSLGTPGITRRYDFTGSEFPSPIISTKSRYTVRVLDLKMMLFPLSILSCSTIYSRTKSQCYPSYQPFLLCYQREPSSDLEIPESHNIQRTRNAISTWTTRVGHKKTLTYWCIYRLALQMQWSYCTWWCNDHIATGDAFVVLGSLEGLPGTPGLKNLYLQSIIDSMGVYTVLYLCHAALNAPCMIRSELVSMVQDNAPLQDKFSKALSSAVQVDGYTTQQQMHGSCNPDSFFYEKQEWDLC